MIMQGSKIRDKNNNYNQNEIIIKMKIDKLFIPTDTTLSYQHNNGTSERDKASGTSKTNNQMPRMQLIYTSLNEADKIRKHQK